MSTPSDITPGARASHGTIRIGQVLSSNRGANSGLRLHPHGHRLVSGWCGADSAVEFWAMDQLRPLGRYVVEAELSDIGTPLPAALIPSGADRNRDSWPAHVLPVVDVDYAQRVVAVAAGRGVHLFESDPTGATLRESSVLRGHREPVARVALNTAGTQALSTDAHGNVLVWNTPSPSPRHALRISKVPTLARFIWNDMLGMVGDDTGRVVCWELESGNRHLQFQAHHGALSDTAFNEDSGILLTAGQDRCARMWNLEQGKQVGSDMAHGSHVNCATFAYAGRFIVTGGADGHVAIWNSTDGDLIDWYFDGGPVYRLAFDRLNGTLVVAGARTIKVLRVDWQRLRELDANARANVLSISPADHAAMFSQPPAAPSVTHAPSGGDAPVGSILAARQTAELPMPDLSHLAVERGPAPAIPGGLTVPMMPESPGGRGETVAPGGPATGPRPVAAGHRPYDSQKVAGAEFGSLAAAMASANLTPGAPKSPSSPTSYSSGGTNPPTAVSDDADAFFRMLGDGARHSRLETDSYSDAHGVMGAAEAVNDPSLDSNVAPPRPAVSAGGPPTEPRGIVARPSAPTTRSRPVAPPEPTSTREVARVTTADVRRQLLGCAVVLAVVTAGTWIGVRTYFTTTGFPTGVAQELAAVDDDYEAATASAADALAAFTAQQNAQLRDYQRRNLPAAEFARVEASVASRIAEQERVMRDAEWTASQAREQALAGLSARRAASATQLANRSAGAAGLVTLLLCALLLSSTIRRARANA